MNKLLIPAILAAAALPSAAGAVLLQFTITGDYQASFQIDSSPVANSSVPDFGFMVTNVPGFSDSLTGTADVSFFNDLIDGGINIREPLRFTTLLNATGPQLYTGPEDSPTFLTGVFDLFEFNGPGTYQLTIGPISGIPEAASWAMMIAGFGLVGAAMRRGRGTVSVRFQPA